ncbi:glycosyltransferase family 4 protein [Desulfosoma sp.]|uniref:glycosyltransferase family 4 protein n=1 Tax=Desulfosoma sp. TaxID=2603217 RepID=UPI004049087C
MVTIHHNVHGTQGSAVLQRLYHLLWSRTIEKANFSKATVLTTVSNFSARSVAASFGPLKIVTIHNGIDLNLFYPSNRQSPSHPFRLILVGTWSRCKGCDLVCPIMQHLGPDCELIHTGRPKLCYPNNRAVAFLNENMLLELYHQADALLLPSRLEGFGQVALEAMACGVPTIATRGSALTELIEDGVTGTLWSQNDIHAFVNAAKRLAGNPDLWPNMRIAARKCAKQNFSIHAMVDRYLGLYQLALVKNLSDNKF